MVSAFVTSTITILNLSIWPISAQNTDSNKRLSSLYKPILEKIVQWPMNLVCILAILTALLPFSIFLVTSCSFGTNWDFYYPDALKSQLAEFDHEFPSASPMVLSIGSTSIHAIDHHLREICYKAVVWGGLPPGEKQLRCFGSI